MALVIGTTTVATGGTATVSAGAIAGTIAAKMVHKALIFKILAGAGAGIGVVGVGAVILATGGTAEKIEVLDNSFSISFKDHNLLEDLLGVDSIENIL